MSNENPIQQKNPVLRLKFTNLKKNAYPDPLEKTDYFGFKVGDIIRERYKTAFYQIESIYRDVLSESDIKYLQGQFSFKHRKLDGTVETGIRDQKGYDLLQEYIKNNNFGIVKINARVVLRGSTMPKKGRLTTFSELHNVQACTYRCFELVDFDDEINMKDYSKSRLDQQIINLQNRKANVDKAKKAIETLRDRIHPKHPTTEPTGIDECDGEQSSGEFHIELNQALNVGDTISDELLKALADVMQKV